MFFIAYKSDNTTACKKQISLSRLTEVGKAAIEQKRIARQNAEEKLAEKQRLDKAETDLKAGKFICWL